MEQKDTRKNPYHQDGGDDALDGLVQDVCVSVAVVAIVGLILYLCIF